MNSRLPEQEKGLLEDTEASPDDESFLHRWSRRKREAQQPENVPQSAQEDPVKAERTDKLPTDADMPPLESLTEDSDYSGFLSPKVSEALRKQALHKLFHSAGVNVRDGLDDYDEDFTEFPALGNIVTADLKHRMDKGMQECSGKIQDTFVEPNTPDNQDEAQDDQTHTVQTACDNTEPKDEKS